MYGTVLLLLTVMFTFGDSLIAYDCRGLSTNITAISIQDVAGCPNPRNEYKEETRRIQIIQKQEISKTKVETCLIEVTRLIQKCGMFSHASSVASGLRAYIKSVGADECRNIHRYQIYRSNGYTTDKTQGNATTTASVTLAGSISMDGKCSGGTYVEDGLTWEDVIVSASLKIKLRDYFATVKLDAYEITQIGGVTCAYTNGYCMDTEIGETIWDRGIQDKYSRSNYHIVYEGIGNFITTNKTDLFSDSKYIVVEQEDRVFALTLLGKSHICYQDAWVTEHPKLMVVEEKEYGFPFLKNLTNSQDIDLLMYINTKFMYIEQAYKRSLHKVYVNLVHRRCLLRRETLKNRLLIAPLSTNAVSILLKINPRTTNCFNELPVQVDNGSLYMAPITHVLQEHGEQIECPHVTPLLYKIDNKWIRLSPLPLVNSEPEILEPADEPVLKFQPIRRLSAGGLYTNQEIREAQKNLIFGMKDKPCQQS